VRAWLKSEVGVAAAVDWAAIDAPWKDVSTEAFQERLAAERKRWAEYEKAIPDRCETWCTTRDAGEGAAVVVIGVKFDDDGEELPERWELKKSGDRWLIAASWSCCIICKGGKVCTSCKGTGKGVFGAACRPCRGGVGRCRFCGGKGENRRDEFEMSALAAADAEPPAVDLSTPNGAAAAYLALTTRLHLGVCKEEIRSREVLIGRLKVHFVPAAAEEAAAALKKATESAVATYRARKEAVGDIAVKGDRAEVLVSSAFLDPWFKESPHRRKIIRKRVGAKWLLDAECRPCGLCWGSATCDERGGSGVMVVRPECKDCAGKGADGCRTCAGRGEVPGSMRCPRCRGNKTCSACDGGWRKEG
jgi:hypothetical protein